MVHPQRPSAAPVRLGSGWKRGKLPISDSYRWIEPAPRDPNSRAPGVQLLSELRNGKERTLKLRLWANGNEDIDFVAPQDARIRTAGVEDFVRPVDQSETGKYYLGCSGRSCDGATLLLTTDQPKPIELLIIGSRRSLPASAAPLLRARPKFARPQYAPDASLTFTRIKL